MALNLDALSQTWEQTKSQISRVNKNLGIIIQTNILRHFCINSNWLFLSGIRWNLYFAPFAVTNVSGWFDRKTYKVIGIGGFQRESRWVSRNVMHTRWHSFHLCFNFTELLRLNPLTCVVMQPLSDSSDASLCVSEVSKFRHWLTKRREAWRESCFTAKPQRRNRKFNHVPSSS